MSTPTEPLLTALAPILARVASFDRDALSDPAAVEAELEREFPHAGAQVQAIGQLIDTGVREGWLADRGNDEARFSRVAKPSPATHELSIDVVCMLGAGLEHTHPRGEITLGFPANPDDSPQTCHFEARPPGWVVLPPNSRHTPTVTGARMNLIYFLPSGAVEWHP